MKILFRTTLLLAIAAAPFANVARAQREGPSERQIEPDARERWNELSPQERERLRQRFEEFRRLDPAQRAELEERMDRLRVLGQRAKEHLPDDLRRKLEGLPESERRELLREYLRTELENRGDRIREMLPNDVRERLEQASPQERAQILGDLRRKWHEAEAPRVIEHLGRELDLAPEEIARLQSLPSKERADALLELRRKALERRGPPPGVSREEWDRWSTLPTQDWIERWRYLAPRRNDFDRDPDGPDLDPERRDFDPDHHRGPRGAWPPGPPPQGGRDGKPRGSSLDQAGAGRLSFPARRELARALRPDPQWIVELGDLPEPERRAQIEQRMRERALNVLELAPEVERAELEHLRTLQGREFFEALRGLAGELCGPHRRLEGGGPRPGGGRRGSRPPFDDSDRPPPPPRDAQSGGDAPPTDRGVHRI